MYRCHSALISHPFGFFPFCSIVSTSGLVSNSYLLFFIKDIDMIEA
jgi:hypothetical protein